MRKRDLRPSFFTNEDLAELDPLIRILFQGLWCIADRASILEDRPKRIKSLVLPYDDMDVDAALDELAEGGFITRYTASTGQGLIHVSTLERHQNFHPGEKPSGYEEPPENSEKNTKYLKQPADKPIATTEGAASNTSTTPQQHLDNALAGCEQVPSNALTSYTSSPSLKEGGDIGSTVSKGTNSNTPTADSESPLLTDLQATRFKEMIEERDLTEGEVCEAIGVGWIHRDNFTKARKYLETVDRVDPKKQEAARELEHKNRNIQTLKAELRRFHARGDPEETEAFIRRQTERCQPRLWGLLNELDADQDYEAKEATA